MNDTPPPPLDTMVVDLLRATGQLMRRLRLESNPDALTWSQVAAMARLGHSDGMTTAELARAELVKPQSMSATLACLERQGLVRRTPHPTDGRQVLFVLTDKGRAMRQHNCVLKRTWLSSAVARLDPAERQTLVAAIDLLKRLGES